MSSLYFDNWLSLVQWSCVVGVSLAACITDLRNRRIPNYLTGPFFAAGLIWAGLTAGLPGLVDAIIGTIVLAFPYIILFIFAHGGAGDAKLMGAIGAWLGLTNGLVALFAVCIAGVIMAVIFAMSKRKLARTLFNISYGIQYMLVGLIGLIHKRNGFKLININPMENMSDQELTVMPYWVSIFIGVFLASIGVWIWQI